ncbi:hypothetical protein COCSADRAFT_289597 [Bipolaris sorokiniana ND90Pr]|uniref:Uncharacterized protein n=1 Tax=Cochliobolus sativus (strain ND90Pr / ATCC 201652) TaxID=665912 RepID=M2TFF5_COCSN|nr:uncharacterized protein COCSADRAFT_289597 [Bipolaris sorokiniana ND90Pr]EMD67472.1 hypothetical protein COCSADRAFT_289597 [Bipolaris sorokiniana ND90Pr]
MRLSSRPSASPSSSPPSSWTHKAGTGPESYGRRCVRVLLPLPLLLGSCSCCTPPPHIADVCAMPPPLRNFNLAGSTSYARLLRLMRLHPSIHPSIYGRFISDILTSVTWRSHHALNCLVPRSSLLCRLQSVLPETTFTGGIACRATPTRRKYTQQPSSLTICFVVPQ